MCLNTAFVSCAIKKLCSVKSFFFVWIAQEENSGSRSECTHKYTKYTEKVLLTGYVGGFEINNNL